MANPRTHETAKLIEVNTRKSFVSDNFADSLDLSQVLGLREQSIELRTRDSCASRQLLRTVFCYAAIRPLRQHAQQRVSRPCHLRKLFNPLLQFVHPPPQPRPHRATPNRNADRLSQFAPFASRRTAEAFPPPAPVMAWARQADTARSRAPPKWPQSGNRASSGQRYGNSLHGKHPKVLGSCIRVNPPREALTEFSLPECARALYQSRRAAGASGLLLGDLFEFSHQQMKSDLLRSIRVLPGTPSVRPQRGCAVSSSADNGFRACVARAAYTREEMIRFSS